MSAPQAYDQRRAIGTCSESHNPCPRGVALWAVWHPPGERCTLCAPWIDDDADREWWIDIGGES